MRQPGPLRIHAVDYRAAQDAADVRAMLDLCMFAEVSSFQEEVTVTGDAGKVEAFVPGIMPADPTGGMVRINHRDTAAIDVEFPDDSRIRYRGHHHGHGEVSQGKEPKHSDLGHRCVWLPAYQVFPYRRNRYG